MQLDVFNLSGNLVDNIFKTFLVNCNCDNQFIIIIIIEINLNSAPQYLYRNYCMD